MSLITSHIYPLTTRVVGAPHMFPQPVFSIVSLFSTAFWDLANPRPVHSLMLSSHLSLCLPCFLLPFIVPWKMVLARPNERKTYHCSLRLFTMVRRPSCGLNACWILVRTSTLVTWSLYEMCNSTTLRRYTVVYRWIKDKAVVSGNYTVTDTGEGGGGGRSRGKKKNGQKDGRRSCLGNDT